MRLGAAGGEADGVHGSVTGGFFCAVRSQVALGYGDFSESGRWRFARVEQQMTVLTAVLSVDWIATEYRIQVRRHCVCGLAYIMANASRHSCRGCLSLRLCYKMMHLPEE